MQNGYHTAKVEWIKDEPIPEEELGNLKIITFIISMKYKIVGSCWKQVNYTVFCEGIHATNLFKQG